MTLLLRTPGRHLAARRYVADVVLTGWLGLDYELVVHDDPIVTIMLLEDPQAQVLSVADVFFATTDDDWLTRRSIPSTPLQRYAMPAPDLSGAPSRTVPVLYGDGQADTVAVRTNVDGAHVAVDVLGSIFFLLSRYEEAVRPDRDGHGRFPAGASVLGVDGSLERPLADEYVELLWAALIRLWPGLRRNESSFRLRLTHDVDQPWAVRGKSLRTVARSLAADVALRRDPGLAAQRLRSLVRVGSGSARRDPFDRFELFMGASERLGLRSTFYFHAGSEPRDYDFRYTLADPNVRPLLEQVHARGHEIGLHTSYDSHLSRRQTQHEFAALMRTCAALGIEQATWGVRQHFLRMEIPWTWRIHDDVGLDHDSSLGFFDRIGFRAGTCRSFPVFDLIEGRALGLIERPLLVMDTTLVSYMNLDLDAAADRVRAIVATCREFRGEAVLLYHNNTLPGARFADHYRELVAGLLT